MGKSSRGPQELLRKTEREIKHDTVSSQNRNKNLPSTNTERYLYDNSFCMTAWSLVDVNHVSEKCIASMIRVKKKVYSFDVLLLVCVLCASCIHVTVSHVE